MISASQLYDFVRCPHRIALDVYGDQSRRDETNPFVQLLWEQGVDHEENMVASPALLKQIVDGDVGWSSPLDIIAALFAQRAAAKTSALRQLAGQYNGRLVRLEGEFPEDLAASRKNQCTATR